MAWAHVDQEAFMEHSVSDTIKNQIRNEELNKGTDLVKPGGEYDASCS